MNASLRNTNKNENSEEMKKYKGRSSDISLYSKESLYQKYEKENRHVNQNFNQDQERKEKMLKKARELNKSSIINRERKGESLEEYLKPQKELSTTIGYNSKNSYLDHAISKGSPHHESNSHNKSGNSEEGKDPKNYVTTFKFSLCFKTN
jgi:hypothetical protein